MSRRSPDGPAAAAARKNWNNAGHRLADAARRGDKPAVRAAALRYAAKWLDYLASTEVEGADPLREPGPA